MSKYIEKEIRIFAESIKSPKDILDVGCGLRPYERFFKGCKYIGIDVEASGRDSNNKIPDKFYDGLHIPFGDNSFDIAICTEVLEHCIDPEKLLSEIYRILKKDGILFFTMPFIWGEHETPYDFRRYTSFGIKRKIEDAGFEIIQISKITRGIKAIEVLVSSEITSYKNNPDYKLTLQNRIKEFILKYLWLVVLRLWNSMYNFNRVYINNLVIAKKK